jgi:hypothetical protein
VNIEDLAADPNAAIQEMLDTPAPVTWRINPNDPTRTLDADTARATWDELRDFVDWLVDRYALDHKTVPPCWYLHGALVDELTALWGAWQTAYWPYASAADPAGWMQIFANTRMRLSEWSGRRGCRPDDHRPDRQSGSVDDSYTWNTHLTCDVDARHFHEKSDGSIPP